MRVFDRERRWRGVVTATRGEVAEGHRSRWLPRLCTDRAWTGLNERCSMTKCQILKRDFCDPRRHRGLKLGGPQNARFGAVVESAILNSLLVPQELHTLCCGRPLFGWR